MRISDWSSDVCSSDLSQVGDIERLATIPPVQLIGGVGPAADLPVPKPDAQPLRRAGLAPAGGVPGHPSSGATALPFRVAIKSRINSDTSSRSAIYGSGCGGGAASFGASRLRQRFSSSHNRLFRWRAYSSLSRTM